MKARILLLAGCTVATLPFWLLQDGGEIDLALAAAVDGCPVTSPSNAQSGATLQGFAANGGSGVTYDAVTASLTLKKEAGIFKSTNFSLASAVVFVCVADFDGDGKQDFIGANDRADQEIALYRNKTNGPAANHASWNDPNFVVTPVFATDYGKIEDNCKHVATNTNMPSASCINGGGGSLACGDFNNDGMQDFIWMRGEASMPSSKATRFDLYRGKGDGTFHAPYQATVTGGSAGLSYFKVSRGENLSAADVNKDGKLDILFGGESQNDGGVSVWLNNGATPSPKFVQPSSPLISAANVGGQGVNGIAWGDFTGDGKDDLVLTGASVKKVVLYTGTGTGTLSPTPTDITSTFPGAGTFVSIGDYSLDGRPDIAVGTDNFSYNAGNVGGEVHYWKNTGTNTPFSAGVTQRLVKHDVPYADVDLGSTIQYDNDPQGTPDIIAADGNHSAGYLILANRVLTQYVACGDVISGVLDLGVLSDDELVITSARMTPTAVKPSGTSITYYMSNEDPANWQVASLCTGSTTDYCVAFPKPVGRSVRWKATMCSNAAKTITPSISGVALKYDYTVSEKHFRAGAVTQDDVTYVGAFTQPGNRGHLYSIDDGLTGVKWDAGLQLDAMADADRRVFGVADNGTRIELTTANAGQSNVIGAFNAATAAQTSAVIAWMRSARFGVSAPLSRLGSVETGTPAVVDEPPEPLWYDYATAADKARVDAFRAAYAGRQPLVLFGSRDGMVHAIMTNPANPADPRNGKEAWAYVPNFVSATMLADQAASTGLPSVSTAYPDGSPTVVDVKFADNTMHTVAVINSGNGGRYAFALDITDTVAADGTILGPTPLWEIQPGGTNVGLTFSKPAIARVKIGTTEKTLALLASGIAPENPTAPYTKGREVVGVDIQSGVTLWKFQAACAVTSDVVPYETNDDLEPGAPQYDGFIDRAAFADACGNIYKINPAQNLSGGLIDSSLLGTIDTGVRTTTNVKIYALFSTKSSPCGLNDARPIVGTLGARTDSTGRFVLFFGTGGIESYTPTKQNAFFSIYTDTGAVRGCPTTPSKGRILGDCVGGQCEKFYGGVVVTSDQVLATRSVDPPIATASCTYGSSELVAFDLNNLDEEFIVGTTSSTVSSLYAIGGAVYFTTLSGAVVRVGSHTAAGTTGTGGSGDGGDDDEDGDGTGTFPLTVAGWRQIQ